MKLKLFLVSIIALLSLVAYQKYAEYSALKSIDSYESCSTAKGSVIQESYPATCITRLGTRFTQPAPSFDVSNWKTYINSKYKFTFRYPTDWSTTGSNEIVRVVPTDILNTWTNTASGGGSWVIDGFYVINPEKLHTLEKNGFYDSTNHQSVLRQNISIDDKFATKFTTTYLVGTPVSEKGSVSEIIYVTGNQLEQNKILMIELLDQNYKMVFDQILSTFHFLD
jgi:hypothetical protein